MINDLGCYFKTVRLYKAISIKEICENSKVSREYLRKLEDNTLHISINKSMMARLEEAMNVKLFFDYDFNKKFKDNETDYYHLSMFNLHEQASELFLKISSLESQLINTKLFPNYLLLTFAHYVVNDIHNHDIEQVYNILDKIQENFDLEIKQRFLYYKALYLINKLKHEKAKECLVKVMSLHYNPVIHSNAQMALGYINLSQKEYLSAYLDFEKAKDLFDNTTNYRKSAECLCQSTLIWLYLNDQNGAITLSETAMYASKIINDEKLIYANYINQIMIYAVFEKYEKVLSITHECLEHYPSNFNMCFYNAYANQKLKNYKQVNIWIDWGMIKQSNRKSYEHRLLRLVKKLNHKPQDRIEMISKMIEETKKQNNFDHAILRILYMEIILAYKQIDDYRLAYASLEEFYGFCV